SWPPRRRRTGSAQSRPRASSPSLNGSPASTSTPSSKRGYSRPENPPTGRSNRSLLVDREDVTVDVARDRRIQVDVPCFGDAVQALRPVGRLTPVLGRGLICRVLQIVDPDREERCQPDLLTSRQRRPDLLGCLRDQRRQAVWIRPGTMHEGCVVDL